jgi:hypothetical protein
MDFDVSEITAQVTRYVENVIVAVTSYYNSLDQMEYIGWGVAALGLVLVILGLIL